MKRNSQKSLQKNIITSPNAEEKNTTFQKSLEKNERARQKSQNRRGSLEAAVVMVHIKGEVVRPGLYELKKGARLVDALNCAGGSTELADLAKLNFAQKLKDGMEIIVSAKEVANNFLGDTKKNLLKVKSDRHETRAKSPLARKSFHQALENEKVHLNRATYEELENIPGIGPITAKNIVEFRMDFGNFSTLEDLLMIHGIGNKKFKKISPYLTLED